MSSSTPHSLRALPAVDALAAALVADATSAGPTHAEAVSAARRALVARRAELQAGAGDDPDLVARARALLAAPGPRRVLNATGIVLHTNLGRAPLADAAADAVHAAARGYVDLELDLHTGARGSRDAHVSGLLAELTGAQDALVVNNGAAATLLAATALGGPGGAIAVSRGQLIEIGGGFRIPDVVAQSGARLVEVGTTNRTRLEDYKRAIAEQQATVVMRVHQANFRAVGFVEEVGIEQLCSLGVPVIDDVGSGSLMPNLAVLADEPPVTVSIAAGAALVCFSGDKLLGGPQAGLILGRAEAVDACRRHPLARALRVGRLPLAGLAATLALYRDPARALLEVPALRMLAAPPEELAARAARLAKAVGGDVVQHTARAGGGALPLVALPGPAAALTVVQPHRLAETLRAGQPPVVPRVSSGRLILDPRTLADDELEPAAAAVAAALKQPHAAPYPRFA